MFVRFNQPIPVPHRAIKFKADDSIPIPAEIDARLKKIAEESNGWLDIDEVRELYRNHAAAGHLTDEQILEAIKRKPTERTLSTMALGEEGGRFPY